MAKDDIDYTAEGATPPHEKKDSTDAGYDEAAHSGSGGVFATTGGGTFSGGMHIEERPTVDTEKEDDK